VGGGSTLADIKSLSKNQTDGMTFTSQPVNFQILLLKQQTARGFQNCYSSYIGCEMDQAEVKMSHALQCPYTQGSTRTAIQGEDPLPKMLGIRSVSRFWNMCIFKSKHKTYLYFIHTLHNGLKVILYNTFSVLAFSQWPVTWGQEWNFPLKMPC
jgi:hypothetical protein